MTKIRGWLRKSCLITVMTELESGRTDKSPPGIQEIALARSPDLIASPSL
ncbi:MAG: hypothetical protein MET45_03210 [Nostoc sp. LLA-1]|nr:hypothetical protein [Cyanocohniella sp. LLY]